MHILGKTMQNVRKQKVLDFVSSRARAMKLCGKPTYKTFNIIREDLITVERTKTTIHFNKPIYVGFTVLDVSKVLMYKFHYDHMKTIYPGDRSQLCFTDTDSFIYEVRTEDIYADMLAHRKKYDWSGYPDSHAVFAGMNNEERTALKLSNKKVKMLFNLLLYIYVVHYCIILNTLSHYQISKNLQVRHVIHLYQSYRNAGSYLEQG